MLPVFQWRLLSVKAVLGTRGNMEEICAELSSKEMTTSSTIIGRENCNRSWDLREHRYCRSLGNRPQIMYVVI